MDEGKLSCKGDLTVGDPESWWFSSSPVQRPRPRRGINVVSAPKISKLEIQELPMFSIQIHRQEKKLISQIAGKLGKGIQCYLGREC